MRNSRLACLIGIVLVSLAIAPRAGAQLIETVVGNGTAGFNGDARSATSAELTNAFGVALDHNGNLYIADTGNQRVRVVNMGTSAITVAGITIPAGNIGTVAGNGTAGYLGDGGAATSAEVYNPSGVSVDTAGNIYIADLYNYRVRKVNTNGIITTVVGNGNQAYGGDNGLAANASLDPYAIAVDHNGVLFVADTFNQRIRAVNTTASTITIAGVSIQPNYIATIAGDGNYSSSGNGVPALSAEFENPYSIAVDGNGNIYICDTYNRLMRVVNTGTSAITVAKITIQPGYIATVAGDGTYGFRGDGYNSLFAEFADPDGIGVDSAGNIYVSDLENERIRMINNATGLVSTIAGVGGSGTVGYGYDGDGIPATSALISYPRTVTADSRGNVYFSDEPNLRIREIAVNPGAPTITSRANTAFTVGVPGTFTITTAALPLPALAEAGSLPAGVNFVNNGNGTATLGGTPGPGTAGTYNLALTGSNGVLPNATQNFTLTVYTAGGGPTATLVSEDTSTGGAWQSKYGTDGFSIASVATQVIPSYIAFAQQNLVVQPYTWVATTNDPRALLLPGSSTGIASTWFNSANFGFDANFTDGHQHQIALYMLDWDFHGRAETIQVQDANSGLPLDTETISNFGAGIYLVWNITGHVQIAITATAGPNAVVSGVFFGGGGQLTVPVLSITKTHTGNFAQGQQNSTYTVRVSNLASSAATSGTVTMTETVSSGLNLVSMAGAGWSCPANGNTCTRNDALAGGSSYSPITVTVNVGTSATSPQVNQVSVSGGGSIAASASDSTVIMGLGGAADAIFNSQDATTHGSWQGVYGADGYSLANATPQSIPAYATFAVHNQTNYTWTASTSDARALQLPTGSTRIAAAWYGSALSFDVNFVDGGAHQFALYALDWDNGGRSETIQIRDAVSNNLLDNRTISNFSNGVYLVWSISGHVTISVGVAAGANAVISGAFFGGAPSANQSTPSISWSAPSSITYGTALGNTQLNASAGFNGLPLPGTFVYTPASGAILTAGNKTLSVTFTPTDTADYKSATGTVTLTVNQATPAINWAIPSPITFGTALSATQLNATASFNGSPVAGTFVYSPAAGVVPVAGSQTLSMAFTPADATDYTPAGGAVTLQVNQPVTSSQATYVVADSTTKGSWQGVYGADGYSIANSNQSISGYATFAIQNQTNYTWLASTSDSRALQTGIGSARIASAWYANPAFNFDVNFTDGNAHQLAIYALDWDGGGRAETIQIRDAGTNTLLDTRTISNFSGGLYLVWSISGHVKVNVALSGGPNAVISGVFFGGASNASQSTPVIAWSVPAAITYGTALSGTQLNATASFNGSPVAGGFVYSPAAGAIPAAGTQTLSVTFTPTDTTDYKTATATVSLTVNQATPTITWATPSPITAGTALSGAQLNATASFNGSPVAGSFVYTPPAGTVLSAGSQTLSVTFTPTDAVDYKTATATVTLVVNSSTTGTTAATFVVADASTQGNWQGVYGADGYSLANSTQSLPAYASFTPSGQGNFTWNGNTTDPRALQLPPSGSSRIASTWYGAGYSLDVNFTDGNTHLFALYALDWDSGGRAETVQVLNASTNAVLDTRTVSSFSNGLYLVWNVSGHVKVVVSLISGSNAVLSGAFFGGNGAISVAVNPQTVNLIANQTQAFTATVTGSSNQTVTWSLNPNVGTITSTGASTATYTAPSSIASAQNITVTASSAAASPAKMGTATVSLSAGTSAANFIGFDNGTQGSWKGVYGVDGYSIAQDSQSLPSYAAFSANGSLFTWNGSTTDVRALQKGSGTGRIASTWYSSPSFSFDVNLANGAMHQVELYALDWDGAGRSETIQVVDAVSNAVLDTRTISGFGNGLYLIWNLSGHVKITVSVTSGANAAISGVFFK